MVREVMFDRRELGVEKEMQLYKTVTTSYKECIDVSSI